MLYHLLIGVFCSKFKLPSSVGMPETSASLASSRDNLGPFAKMMLESTDIAFRCKLLFVSERILLVPS